MLEHKHGGLITAINAIGHTTYKGVAEWYYIGDISWNDSGKSLHREIPPYLVCFNEEDTDAATAYRSLSEQLNEYLENFGSWLEKPKTTRDGRLIHWCPTTARNVHTLRVPYKAVQS